ncbi:unnamed protein product [Kuraishia capsulata CBS 1993]|uniref:HTH APSES-type domain-containing protein n=1 Tax=Kuraishia capsulata CBS 1993 TaxID=1382522 RepID=W6MHY7_9ASCO|nr:uncharacterized protein KUCA_T00001955001 [Kuraishia capsulata CBS 1993]CDK25984.1 unnamed protein product [Kuraishia capsulata CBS 1993]
MDDPRSVPNRQPPVLPNLSKMNMPLPSLDWSDSLLRFGTSGSGLAPVQTAAPASPVRLFKPPAEAINYPIHSIPVSFYDQIPPDQLSTLPKPNSISRRKYSTGIDERNFVTVYEFQVNNNWIIWDYHTGLVHLTGLWKAIGNHKADIVKLIEASPELATVVRRVRGGFLKIQGTWVPYDVARTLATKFCYAIRFSLIAVFGESFVADCLTPHDKGFGLLRLYFDEDEYNGVGIGKDGRRRRRRRTSAPKDPRDPKPPRGHRQTKSLPGSGVSSVVSRDSLYGSYRIPADDPLSSDLSRPKMFGSDREGIFAVLQAARLQDRLQPQNPGPVDTSTLEAARSLMGVSAGKAVNRVSDLQETPRYTEYGLYATRQLPPVPINQMNQMSQMVPAKFASARGKMDIHGLLS